jgi:hypothetical protein
VGRLLGSGALIVVAIVVIAVIVAIPLITVYKSKCGSGDDRETEYSFVLPWNDPSEDCRDHQNGFEIVTDAVGLD